VDSTCGYPSLIRLISVESQLEGNESITGISVRDLQYVQNGILRGEQGDVRCAGCHWAMIASSFSTRTIIVANMAPRYSPTPCAGSGRTIRVGDTAAA
jgi:hypothetical protein